MTNQELKLECFRLSGRGFNPLFEEKLHEAKRLYEWVSCEDEDRVTKYIRHALKEGVDLYEDLKEKPDFMKEKSPLLGEFEKVVDQWLEEAREIGVLRSDIDTPVAEEHGISSEEVVSNLEEKGNPTETLIITDEDIVDLHYKGEDIIVCRSWEHIPEDREGKTVFWVTRVFEDEGVTTKIKFI